MTTDPWRDVAIRMRWSNEERGPYLVEVRFHRGEGWQPTGLSIDLLNPAEGRSLGTGDLRTLGMPAIAELAYEKLIELLKVEHAKALAVAPAPGDERLDYRKRLAAVRHLEEALEATGPRKAGRPAMPRAALEKIAQIYCDAYYRRESPTQAVADYLGCDKATAARRVALCRKRGVLLGTERGVAGGIPLAMRRVTASDLDLLNLNKERGQRLRRSQPELDEHIDEDAERDGEEEQ